MYTLADESLHHEHDDDWRECWSRADERPRARRYRAHNRPRQASRSPEEVAPAFRFFLSHNVGDRVPSAEAAGRGYLAANAARLPAEFRDAVLQSAGVFDFPYDDDGDNDLDGLVDGE